MTWRLKAYGMATTLLFSLAGVCFAAAQPGIMHDLSVRLHPSQHRMEVVDRVTIHNIRQARLEFKLAMHLSVNRVTIDGSAGDFSFKRGRLQISLPSRGDSHSIRIDYSGVFDDEIPVDPINTDNPGFGVTGTIDPKGTMLLSGAGWYPHSQHTDTTYKVTVDAPEGTMAITSGKPLGHATENGRSISRWLVDVPLRGLPLVAGPYTVATKRFGNVAAATYFTGPLQRLSEDYLDAVGRYLQLYEELFGPYPFEQFAVVENTFPTGYGFPSFTLLGRRVLQLPFIIHTSLGHEIAHCWWGNGVLVDHSQGNWSEGLTTYVADYLYKERRGEGITYRRQWLRNYAGLVNSTNDFAPAEFVSRTNPATKVVGYDKIAMVFHMLRQKVGEDNFWQSLRDIYARNRFKAINWTDIQEAFEGRSGMDLEAFLRQWIFKPGAPKLALADVRTTATDTGFKISGTVWQEYPYYKLPLELALETDRGIETQRIAVSGARTPFTLMSGGQPKKLIADPEVHLFRRLAPQEIPPTVNSIKGAKSVSIVVSDALDPSAIKLARRLSAAMGLSRARVGREASFAAEELKDSDLLYFGIPSSAEGLPGQSEQFAITQEGFIFKGETYNGNGSSFFGVFRHPANKARTATVFIPGRLDLAKSLSTKIPHYGKYSYLVFNGTRNQVKGTWTVVNSPLSVRWPASQK